MESSHMKERQPNTTTPKRTPEEQALLDDMATLEGRPLTEQEENLAVEQAKAIGDL